MPGVNIGTIEHKMGIRGSATSEIIFDEVCVPSANVLGQVGTGFVFAMQALDGGRVGLGAACIGGTRAALEWMAEYASIRQQFGHKIGEKQSVQWMIANSAADLEALTSLVYRTAWMADTHQPFTLQAGACKLLGSEIASRAIDRGCRFMGPSAMTAIFHRASLA